VSAGKRDKFPKLKYYFLLKLRCRQERGEQKKGTRKWACKKG
jgi:hypothetical protein